MTAQGKGWILITDIKYKTGEKIKYDIKKIEQDRKQREEALKKLGFLEV